MQAEEMQTLGIPLPDRRPKEYEDGVWEGILYGIIIGIVIGIFI